MVTTPAVGSFCNPILDLVAECDEEWFQKYHLELGGYTQFDEKTHKGIYEAMLAKPEVQILAGGSGQNTCSIAAALLGPNKVVTHGMVGGNGDMDSYGKKMVEAATERGVVARYGTSNKAGTGISAISIHRSSRDRSMCTDLGATKYYVDMDLKPVLASLKDFTVVHVTGFFLTATKNGTKQICEQAGASATTLLSVTLSAPFILDVFSDEIWNCFQYAQVISGNDDEWKKLGEVFKAKLGFGPSATPDIKDVVKALADSAFAKGHADQPRICIATCGANPTIVAAKLPDGAPTELFTVPVKPVPEQLIKDTNGCGDAFIGGVIASICHQFEGEKTFDIGVAAVARMVELGHQCAVEVLQHQAFQYSQDYLKQLAQTLTK